MASRAPDRLLRDGESSKSICIVDTPLTTFSLHPSRSYQSMSVVCPTLDDELCQVRFGSCGAVEPKSRIIGVYISSLRLASAWHGIGFLEAYHCFMNLVLLL